MIKKAKKIKKKSAVKNKITKGILMGDLIEKYPRTAEILMKHGFHCLGCAVSPYESLEAGAAVHGIALGPLLKEINKLVK